MALTIDQFAEECQQILSTDSGESGLEQVRLVVETFLADQEFISEHLGPDNEDNRRVLYEDPELEFCICAHVFKGANEAPPHDHGPTWAIYGQATGQTVMTEFEQVSPPADDSPGKVKPTKSYDLDPGMAVTYPIGRLHSPKREGETRLIRIEGKDVTKLSRDAYERA
jgi:predicted metal-dependent enzyme (double-stranded beta helix superfamily)|tara:strand:- start:345 stop:848 length:504 start_codon:yes stop_codon:yes gene_type:complete